jgi:hypothetical protein
MRGAFYHARMRRYPALVLAFLLLAPARGSGDEPPKAEPPAAPAPPARSTIVGTHVEASGDVPAEVLEEAASLGDQLVPLLAEHFEAEVPKSARPLRVEIHATQAAFRAAVRAEGGIPRDPESAGGYSPRNTLVSHLWLQDEPFDTRRLVLHELVHQVQDKTFAEFGPGTDTEWHREGLAEHFGWHVRGRGGLVVGQVDALARNRMPWEIANEIACQRMDPLEQALTAKQHRYPESLALVHALLVTKDTALRDRFRKWERSAWRSQVAGSGFAAAFKEQRKEVRAALEEVWRWRAWPWEVRLGRWDEDAGRIRGRAEALGVLVRGSFVDATLSAVLPPARPTRARLIGGGRGTAGIQVGLGTGTFQSVVGFGERLVRLERSADTISLRLLTSREMKVLRTWRLSPQQQSEAWILELAPDEHGIQAMIAGEPPERDFLPLETLLEGLQTPAEDGQAPKPAALREAWSQTWFHGALYVRAGEWTFEDVTLMR